MAIKRYSVRFLKLPAGSVCVIEWNLTAQAGPADAELYELTQPPVTQKSFAGQLRHALGVGCAGRVRIPITGNAPQGTVEHRVEDANGTTIRRARHDLSTLGLKTGDLYVCRSDFEPV